MANALLKPVIQGMRKTTWMYGERLDLEFKDIRGNVSVGFCTLQGEGRKANSEEWGCMHM